MIENIFKNANPFKELHSEDTAGFLPDFFLNFLVEKFFSYDLDVSSGV